MLEAVWAHRGQAITVRQVHNVLSVRREVAYTTVLATMGRMVEKGLLARVGRAGAGPAFSYMAVYGRAELRALVAG